VLGKNLRDLREKKTWSQQELARRAKVSRIQIARLETDSEPNPKWLTVLALAEALGVSCEAFATEGAGKKK